MTRHRPFYVRRAADHTMGDSLHQYIQMKLHHLVECAQYEHIHVCGRHDRHTSVVSKREKDNKLVNWQRPTAAVHDRTLVLQCFPGRDYVRHYASLTATYMALSGGNPLAVTYELPASKDIRASLISEGLDTISLESTVVIGKVEESLVLLNTSTWNHSSGYIWATDKSIKTTFLGCKFSFWGDICGHLTRLLHQKGVKRLLFLGKLGSLRGHHAPNEILSTGNLTILNGRPVTWWNGLSRCFCGEQNVATGRHITLYSVLRETTRWLAKNPDYDFVDPEIGHMANAAVSVNVEFAYLHIVSDNLARKYAEDLSNERLDSVLRKRRLLQKQVNRIALRWIEQ